MDPNDLRIGDAEREQTMAALREHFAQGRLTHEELDERLDQALAAKTARDLATVTADLPGPRPAPGYSQPGHGEPGYREPALPHPGMDGWREAMHAHRQQMQSMRQAQRDMRQSIHQARRDMRRGHHGHPWRGHRHGPHPIVGLLFVAMILGLIFGGGGIFKVLLVVWIGAMLFSFVRGRFHHRG
ncbi:DUF1707 domain-containing protein [Nonomuraea phyllanthi]|uniref:DUF1707 SHOCT-like domain-containing protein n=1 Tax=Nonomuraea phyllanthi TaxID=2219224 RepID=UPI001292D651|nr:DUF1707 domain-containing protein [Nonomuraea phyllanthi]QFY11448.1 DUF1707 domain-containing protein [Nonomuraea phyllanthi]